MSKSLQIGGGLILRNTTLNLTGQVTPLLVGVAVMPYIIRDLGTERFGVLAIAWALLGYMSVLDLGLGRSTTKFVAESLGRSEVDRVQELVRTSLGFQALFGIAGGIIGASGVPILVTKILKVPAHFTGEVRTAFFILAGSFPIVLVSGTFRGVLEAAQRFDLVNYVKLPANISVFLLPAIAVRLNFGLPGIVVLLVLSRVIATLAFAAICFRLFPGLMHQRSWNWQSARPLLTYGGWIMVSNVVAPLLANMDRFFIGSVLSLDAVSYYSVPAELTTRLSVFPASLFAALLPAFSTLRARGAEHELKDMYMRSIKFLLLILAPVLLLLVVFAHDILRVWLGIIFAVNSTRVLQVLAVGTLITSVAYVPFGLLQGIGRSDLPAKYHLLEFPVYAIVLWVLVTRVGIVGAALACTLRLTLDAVLLFWGCYRLKLSPVRALSQDGVLRSAVAVFSFGLVLFLTCLMVNNIWVLGCLSAILLVLFVIVVWNRVIDERDKSFLLSRFSRLKTSIRKAPA